VRTVRKATLCGPVWIAATWISDGRKRAAPENYVRSIESADASYAQKLLVQSSARPREEPQHGSGGDDAEPPSEPVLLRRDGAGDRA
jgi:hypothetical protein